MVKKGDTLSSIFSNLDIHHELIRVLNLGKQAKPFKKIYPGQKLHFTFSDNGIEKLELEKSRGSDNKVGFAEFILRLKVLISSS